MSTESAKSFEFELVTPESQAISVSSNLVVMPGREGHLGVLPNHAPMIVELGLGIVDIYVNGKVEDRIYINSGFADISQEKCTILAESATMLSDVDLNQITASIENLENVVKNAQVDTVRQTAQAKLLESRILKNALENGPTVEVYNG